MQTHIALDQRLRLCCVAGSSAVSQHMRPDSAIGDGTQLLRLPVVLCAFSCGAKYSLPRNEMYLQSLSIALTSASYPR